jgi:hypothetical protein
MSARRAPCQAGPPPAGARDGSRRAAMAYNGSHLGAHQKGRRNRRNAVVFL